MHALLPIAHFVRSFPIHWVLFTCIVFTDCRSVRLHFRPSRLQLRSRYRSIVARAPKLQGRSSNLHGSDLKSLSNIVGWMQGLNPCITSALGKHCNCTIQLSQLLLHGNKDGSLSSLILQISSSRPIKLAVMAISSTSQDSFTYYRRAQAYQPTS